MPQYTDTQRSKAVELFEKVGRAEASRQTGIPGRTIGSWAKTSGIIAQASVQKTEAAREVLAATRAKQRENVRILYLDKIEACLEAINPGKPRDAKDLMTTAAIGTDKFRLEMGEATALIITGDMMDQAINEMRAELGDLDST